MHAPTWRGGALIHDGSLRQSPAFLPLLTRRTEPIDGALECDTLRLTPPECLPH